MQAQAPEADAASPARRAGDRSDRASLIAVASILLCAALVYANGFTGLFLGLDGKESIRDNPHIRRLWPLSEAMSVPLWTSSLGADNEDTRAAVARRPILSLTFALNHRLGGLDPTGYHAVNVAIHAAAALLLFGILRRTFALPQLRRSGARVSPWVALAAALVWLAHPLQTESVTYVVQRSESLMGLLMFATLYCAIRSFEGAHRLRWQAASVACCAVGMGVKETQMVAPAVVGLYDAFFVSGSVLGALRARPVFYVALGATPAIVVLLTLGALGEYGELSPAAFALAQPRVILEYLRLALWPDHLFLYVNTSVFDVRSLTEVVASAAAVAAMLIATAWGVAQRRWYGFLGAFFFLTLFPSSTLGTDKIQEHRMYVPLAAVVVLAVVAVDLAVRAALSGRMRARAVTGLRVGLAVAAVVALGARSHVRNRDYHHEFGPVHPADLHEAYTVLADHAAGRRKLLRAEERRARATLASADADGRDLTFARFVLGFAHLRRGEPTPAAREFAHVLALEPGFAYAHTQLGVALRDQGNLRDAISHLERALWLKPDLYYGEKELAVALKEQGNGEAAAWRLRHVVRRKPAMAEAHYELGMLAAEDEEYAAAAEHYRRAIRYRPTFADAHYELAQLLEAGGDHESAMTHLLDAVRFRPDFSSAQLKLARLWQAKEHHARARRHLRLATRGGSADAETHVELGRVLLRGGRSRSAARHLRRGVELLEPQACSKHDREELAAVRTELGMAVARQGDTEGAIREFAEAVRLDPAGVQAHVEMGIALRALGDEDAAVERLHEAIRLRPDAPDAYKALGIVLRDRGDLDGAARHFEKAVSLQPDFADAHNELGWVRQQQGDLRSAAFHFERALALRKDFPEARSRLEALREMQAAARPGSG